jgi:hypothetical protein
MALTKSSVLHYWSSRYGINPRIGGRPVFTRNGAGLFTTQEGELDTAIVNTPRFDWATLNLPNSLTERRKVLTLELARTNLVGADFSSWTVSNATVTPAQVDPAGGLAASLVTATVAGGSIRRAIAFTANESKGVSVRMRQGSAASSIFGIYSNTAAAWRAQITVTWTAGVPTLSVTAGAALLFPPRQMTGGYWDLEASAQGVVASDSNDTYVYPAAASTGTVYAYLPQDENGIFATSPINGFSASRAADSCYWNFPPTPQAMMGYARFVERGTILITGTRLLVICNAAGANPEFAAVLSSGGFYGAYQNGVSSFLAIAPTVGDTVEIATLLQSGGNVQAIQSINGAAVTSGSLSGASALPGAWSDAKLWANSEGAVNPGATGLAEAKLVKYADVVASTAQGIMDELRAFELGPNGDVL